MFLQDSKKEEQNIGVLSINFKSWLKLIYKNPNFVEVTTLMKMFPQIKKKKIAVLNHKLSIKLTN